MYGHLHLVIGRFFSEIRLPAMKVLAPRPANPRGKTALRVPCLQSRQRLRSLHSLQSRQWYSGGRSGVGTRISITWIESLGLGQERDTGDTGIWATKKEFYEKERIN